MLAAVVNISGVEGDAFVDAAGGVKAEGKQGAVTHGIKGKTLVEEELNFGLGENLGATVTVYFHLLIIPP